MFLKEPKPIESEVWVFCFIYGDYSVNWLARKPVEFLVSVRIRIFTQNIGVWCNGNIRASKTFDLGPNPSTSAKK